MKDRKGTREDFVAWLRSKKPDEVVGHTHGAPTLGALDDTTYGKGYRNLCPIGCYSAETGNDPRYGTMMELRSWAFSFMEDVDEEAFESSPEPITARRCLELLREAS